MKNTRRDFIKASAAIAAVLGTGALPNSLLRAANPANTKIKLGMVTYLWGQNWDLPTIIANCEKTGIQGVEARTQHAHGIEPSLSAAERIEIKKRFADSPIEFVGPGTNQCFDSPDPAKLKAMIEGTKEFIKLSHDCGGTGVKVKPNDLHKEVDQEITIAQIAGGLNEVGKFAADYGQKIRVEVHGSCSRLPIMKKIIDQVEAPSVGLCWNCNDQDLQDEGFQKNFDLVKDRFADTAHVRELNIGDYPYQDLITNFVKMNFEGWVLLECRTKPDDLVAAYTEQKKVFEEMIAKA